MMTTIILGVLASVLPNYAFRRVYFRAGDRTPQQIVKGLYLGTILKVALLMGLLTAFLHWPNLQATVFFFTFLLTQCALWLYFKK